MNSAIEALTAIRDKFYLPPDEFRQALHNDPGILKEDEYFYLNRLVETENQIIQSLQNWAEKWNESVWDDSSLTEFSTLLTEIVGPLTSSAKAEIGLIIQTHFSKPFIDRLPKHLQRTIIGKEKDIHSKSKFLPWVLLIIGLVLLMLSQYYLPMILLPLGASALLAGASWLFLRS